MKTQKEMFWQAHRKIANLNMAIMDCINDPVNPMTKKDLLNLIALKPGTYSRFKALADNMK